MTGRIHSIETMGTVDGPGMRMVVFLQGCPMRCAYCHNPDTWKPNTGTQMSVDEILEMILKKKEFYANGGITCTGGEPLMQIDFLTELFERCHEEGIHTCLDSSGIMFNEAQMDKYDRLMKVTDLVMLDIKHIDAEVHQELVKQPNNKILEFARYLDKKHIPLWIRHVLVPGVTDKEEHLVRLGEFLAELSNLQALDVLPYHTMGVVKYQNLGMEYKLKDVPAMDPKVALEKKQVILNGIKKRREERRDS
ncbi:MAG: pyruvate formate lyase-activating protein [Veillonella sp.]|nr:pyruvate formate lyase-activating protein [Veillonella sp.]